MGMQSVESMGQQGMPRGADSQGSRHAPGGPLQGPGSARQGRAGAGPGKAGGAQGHRRAGARQGPGRRDTLAGPPTLRSMSPTSWSSSRSSPRSYPNLQGQGKAREGWAPPHQAQQASLIPPSLLTTGRPGGGGRWPACRWPRSRARAHASPPLALAAGPHSRTASCAVPGGSPLLLARRQGVVLALYRLPVQVVFMDLVAAGPQVRLGVGEQAWAARRGMEKGGTGGATQGGVAKGLPALDMFRPCWQEGRRRCYWEQHAPGRQPSVQLLQ